MSTRYLQYKIIFAFIIVLVVLNCHAQDTSFIRVHFLYGSKPLKSYKKVEPSWFGGILGGHVGLESDSNKILNFVPAGKFHLIPKKIKHSRYTIDSLSKFYSRLGGQHPDSAKQAIVIIPVTKLQKEKFDSISSAYLVHAPYDYALTGMRCGSATYEILAQLGILKKFSLQETAVKIIYPKKLRMRLLGVAKKSGWTVLRHNGTCHRKWETDE